MAFPIIWFYYCGLVSRCFFPGAYLRERPKSNSKKDD